MKRVILSLIILWILPFQNVYGSAQTYTDAKHHFSLELPAGWTLQDIPKLDGAEYIAAFNKGAVYPYLLIQQFTDSGSLNELKSTFDEKFTKLNESSLPISIMSYGGSTIDYDKNALLYSYTAKNENNEAFEAKGALFVGSGISTQLMYYDVTPTSDENEEDFNFIIDQFQYAEGYKVLKNDPLGDTVASAIVMAIIVGVIIITLTIRRRKNNFPKTGGISIKELDKDIVQWFYIKNTQKQGPFNKDEIFDLYFKNEIDEGTFLWKRGIKEWTKLEDIPYLNKLILQPPPVHIGSSDIIIDKSELINDIESVSTDEIQVDRDSTSEYPQGRPWIRYLAKMIDVTIFILVVGVIMAFLNPDFFYNVPEVGIIIFFIIGWSIVEPLVLVSMGNTIGKKVLNTKIKSIDGLPISYKQAYNRSFICSLKGMGLCIPIFSLITMIFSYNELAKDGSNSWNKDNGLEIIHNKVGIFKISTVIVFLLVITIYFYIP